MASKRRQYREILQPSATASSNRITGRLDLIGPGNDAPDKDCYPSKTGGMTVNSRIRNDLAISLLATGKLKINVRLLKTSQLKDTKNGEPCAGGFVRPATFLDYTPESSIKDRQLDRLIPTSNAIDICILARRASINHLLVISRDD